MESSRKNVKIVKPTAPVPFSTAKQDDMDAKFPADIAGALVPWSGLQNLSVAFGAIGPPVVNGFIRFQCVEDIVDDSLLTVVSSKQLHALLFEPSCRRLVHLTGHYSPLKLRGSVCLWHPDSGKASIRCKV